MGDAADILGLKKGKKVEGFVSAIGGSLEASKRPVKKRDMHPPNVSREVYKLLGGQLGSGTGQWLCLDMVYLICVFCIQRSAKDIALAAGTMPGGDGSSNPLLPSMMPTATRGLKSRRGGGQV